jgi:type IV pilus assembly protein PilP
MLEISARPTEDGRNAQAVGQPVARIGRRQTFMVRVGNYMGQNFGLVTKISETEVDLKEIVQDAAGEWVERPSKLELQEAAARQQGSKR